MVACGRVQAKVRTQKKFSLPQTLRASSLVRGSFVCKAMRAPAEKMRTQGTAIPQTLRATRHRHAARVPQGTHITAPLGAHHFSLTIPQTLRATRRRRTSCTKCASRSVRNISRVPQGTHITAPLGAHHFPIFPSRRPCSATSTRNKKSTICRMTNGAFRLAGAEGIEPSAYGFGDRRSTG